jgi:hypothetical protein
LVALAMTLGQLETEHGHPLAALDHLALAICNCSGNVTNIRNPLAILAAFLNRLGLHEPAATGAGFGFSPLNAAAFAEISPVIAQLRDVLGEQTYESLAGKGGTMTTAETAAYACDQIDQARAELNAIAK